jgi:DNA-3-methyladenine glycosylase II
MNKKVEIALTGLFSTKECLWFLNRGFDDCIYRVYPDKVRRAFKLESETMLVDIYLKPEKLLVEWLNGEPSGQGQSFVLNFITDWFDLETDLGAFYNAIAKDQQLAYMPDAFRGLRFIGMPDLFEALCWGIIGQQINLKFAYTMKRKLVEKYGEYIDHEDERYYVFPTPAQLARADISELKQLQLSTKKAEYLITIATAFANGTLSKQVLLELPDFESRVKFLTGIRGIGVWTASYALMKSLKERSSIPYGDAGLVNALIRHGIITNKTDKQAISDFFKKFPGWESYIVFYLWRSLAVQ